MKLTDMHRFDRIVIQIHNDPDADAVGSGYAIYRYFLSLGKDVRLVYGGKNPVHKSNMRLMISELEIPLEYVQELDDPELLLTVDCQYVEGNVQRFAARNIAMIDHHETGRTSDETAEIRAGLVSCATVCYSMLLDAAGKPRELLPFAKQCRSESSAVILARPLEKFTKVFSTWNYEGYMAGAPDDMLCCTEGDTHDVYVVKRETFDTLYEEEK